jgi:hypothetical protein
MRLTDGVPSGFASSEMTTTDFPFGFTVPCTPTADTSTGAACTLTTTANAQMPGIAVPRTGAVFGMDRFEVYDGGPDEDADTAAGNSLFSVQGVFAP